MHVIHAENIDGVGGLSVATEEGNIRIVLPTGEDKTIPALVANSQQLPPNCKDLLGISGIGDLQIDLNAQKAKQRQPLQCNLSEKRL